MLYQEWHKAKLADESDEKDCFIPNCKETLSACLENEHTKS